MNARSLILMTVALCGGSAAPAQIVQGRVDSAGFQTSAGSVFRAGQWFPILVSLTTQGSQVFAGELRVEGIDLDGDRLAFKHTQVTVAGDLGGAKRFWCHAVANAENELPTRVDVVSQDGELVAELPMPTLPPHSLRGEDLLVLDLSYPEVSGLRMLAVPNWSPGQPTEGVRRFYRNVVVARMPADQLPDRWLGLEAVDVVVWDLPDPTALTIAQRDALVEWVRNGGQLIVGVGANWSMLHKSDLAPILPLAGAAETVEVSSLPNFFDRFAPPALRTREFRNPIAVTAAREAEGAMLTFQDRGPDGPLSLITMRLVESGRVVATAASLRDLAGDLFDREKVFAALIDLNRYTDKFIEKQADRAQFGTGIPSVGDFLYGPTVKPVAFESAKAAYSLLAFVFVVAYAGLATLVSWLWLRRQDRTSLSWSVFAGLAAAASVLTLGTVGTLRGCSRGVQSLCVLDLEAGTYQARGPCLFGYRSPTRQRVDLSLPGEGTFLRPLARDPLSRNYYVTRSRYAGVPAQGTLSDVLMRATLKQVEGYWSGQLEGTIRADLIVDRGTGRLTNGSWIANELTHDIDGGFLLLIDPRQGRMAVPHRAAGLTTRYELPSEIEGTPDEKPVPPALNVLALPIPPILAGQRVSGLGAQTCAELDRKLALWNRPGATRIRSQLPDLPTLFDIQQEWAQTQMLGAVGVKSEYAIMLASTRNYHLHAGGGRDFESVGAPLRTDGLPNLEITHWLMRGQAVLLCWARYPGPARLHRDGQPLDSYRGLTVFRVRMPIDYEGTPPRGDRGPSQDFFGGTVP